MEQNVKAVKTSLRNLRDDLAKTNSIRKSTATLAKEEKDPRKLVEKLKKSLMEWKHIQRRMDEETKKSLNLIVTLFPASEEEQQQTPKPKASLKRPRDEEKKETTEKVEVKVEKKKKLVDRKPWDYSSLDPNEWGYESGEFICVFCAKDQGNEEKMASHHDENVKSKACCAGLDRNSNEKSEENDSEETFSCLHCPAGPFLVPDELDRHVKLKHEIKCKVCASIFPSRGYLTNHMKNNHPVEYEKRRARRESIKLPQ